MRNILRKITGSDPKPTGTSHLESGSGDGNIEWNRRVWGDEKGWRERHAFGYRWGGGAQQAYNETTLIAEKYLLPHLGERRDLMVLEIAPGAGRFTTELIRVARGLTLVDLNEACIKLCRERFQYYTHIEYLTNDGRGIPMVPDSQYDLIAVYDAFVHVEPEIIRGYVRDMVRKLVPGGLAWIDHSGKGKREAGNRTAMTDAVMRDFAAEAGLAVEAQHFRNEHDCISVLRKAVKDEG